MTNRVPFTSSIYLFFLNHFRLWTSSVIFPPCENCTSPYTLCYLCFYVLLPREPNNTITLFFILSSFSDQLIRFQTLAFSFGTFWDLKGNFLSFVMISLSANAFSLLVDDWNMSTLYFLFNLYASFYLNLWSVCIRNFWSLLFSSPSCPDKRIQVFFSIDS